MHLIGFEVRSCNASFDQVSKLEVPDLWFLTTLTPLSSIKIGYIDLATWSLESHLSFQNPILNLLHRQLNPGPRYSNFQWHQVLDH